MLGIKQRNFASLKNVCLSDLVPAHHFYRQLEQKLDLSFVRVFVESCYLPLGRPSVDPVVFFKLQLIMFFEGIRSERHLLKTVADRLSLRWYLGYDLTESLPHHSSLTKIRTRYGLEVFRKFFDAIVDQCQKAGLIWGHDLYFDGTQVLANAALTSAQPRFALEAKANSHLTQLFANSQPIDQPQTGNQVSQPPPTCETDTCSSPEPDSEPSSISLPSEKLSVPLTLPVKLDEELRLALEEESKGRYDWLEKAGKQNRQVRLHRYQRMADFTVSQTDPDATFMHLKRGGSHFGYHTHYGVDGGKARIIVAVLVTPAEVMENQPMLDLLWRSQFRFKIQPCQVTGDTAYGTLEIIKALEDANIRAYVPLPDFDKRTPFFGKNQFRYDEAKDVYICPQGQPLTRHNLSYSEQIIKYRAEAQTCQSCVLKAKCTDSENGRGLNRNFEEAYLDKVRGYHKTTAYRKAMRKRQVWVEPLFGEAKQWHGLERFRLQSLDKVNGEALLTASGQNIKRLLKEKKTGKGSSLSNLVKLPITLPFIQKRQALAV